MVASFEFNDLKDKESVLFCVYEQQPEGKAMFKSKFCHELGEMKEIIFPKVQLMTAITVVNHKQQNIVLNTTVNALKTNLKLCIMMVLENILSNINITVLVPLFAVRVSL